LLAGGWIPAATFLGSFSLIAGVSVLVLNGASGGWFWFYVFEVPATHNVLAQNFLTFWRDDILWAMPLASLGLVYFLCSIAPRHLRFRPSEHPRFLFWALLFVSLLGLSLGGRLHSGGYFNVLMPAYAALSLALGLALHRSTRAGPREALRSTLIPIVCGVQLIALAWDPRPYWPTEQNRRAGDQLVELIGQFPGEVWVTENGYLGTLAGRASHIHTLAADDVRRGASPKIVRALRGDIVHAIEGHRFDAILIGKIFSPRLRRSIEQSYDDMGPALKPPSARFGPVTGLQENPRLYLPKGRERGRGAR